jgi:transcriptional regulator with XRE-family HTH domain
MIFRLREILKERQLTIAEFSKKSGISQSNLSNYMSGKVSPTLDTLTKIAESLAINVSELFEKEEDIVIFIKYKNQLIEISQKELVEFVKEKISANTYAHR